MAGDERQEGIALEVLQGEGGRIGVHEFALTHFNAELTRSIMVRHGALAEHPFAEGFDILRIVGTFERQ